MKQIKVEHTRTHTISIPPEKTHITSPHGDEVIDAYINTKSVLVTDAELVLVDRNTILDSILWIENGNLFEAKEVLRGEGDKNPRKSLKPVLISRTENWQYGEQVYHEASGKIIILDKNKSYNEEYLQSVFKILALPEHFSQSTLQAIVDGQLKEGKVLVECENIYDEPPPHIHSNRGEFINLIKLNPTHITIYPVKEKMYTREELQEYLYELGFWCGNVTRDSIKEWFKQNVK